MVARIARSGDTARVAYELYLIPVPAGADLEERGEALLARLARGHERTALSEHGREWACALAQRLAEEDPELAQVPVAALAGSVELHTRTGIQVALAEHFVRFLLPFSHFGGAAETAFRELFALAAVAAQCSGWHAYDPQEGAAIALDEGSSLEALEIYLSVMDQLRPEPAAPGGGTAAPS